MNVLYEEDGSFKVGTILAETPANLQVEAPHGKRSKIKTNHVLLRFTQPAANELLEQAQQMASELDTDFLWECCGESEFAFQDFAADYFGHPPNAIEASAIVLKLHQAPVYFHRKGKGQYKAAPAETLKAALAGLEKKRQQAELQAHYTESLVAGQCPDALLTQLPQLLYKPDRNQLITKALENACHQAGLTTVGLLRHCGVLTSSHDYHFNRFLFEVFPQGLEFPPLPTPQLPELPCASVQAFSIDDSSTTEIDDAFSLARTAQGDWQVGIHIAAPALCCEPDSALLALASQRLSTVYMPGQKITMLPPAWVETFTLAAGRYCPALSLYVTVSDDETRQVLAHETRLEQVYIAKNLRIDTLEPFFNENSAPEGGGTADYPYKTELVWLWQWANCLEQNRGKADPQRAPQWDYNFSIHDDRVCITPRKRGAPIDKLVSELMIFANSTWGGVLKDADIAGIYRSQNNGKVKMNTTPLPHQGLGVAQYAWTSSPLRRYVDLVNQRQLLAWVRQEEPLFAANSPALFEGIRNFDSAYDTYNEFQRQMERYWCLRWITQENLQQTTARVLKENWVRFEQLPLVVRVSSLPADCLPGSIVSLAIEQVDDWDMTVECRFLNRLDLEA